ncbi:MAG: hydrogenase maturation protease [Chloroflexota bacterium]
MPQDHSIQSAQGRTLVLGVGNILQGDDGLGVRLVEMLAKVDLPDYVVIEEAGTPGIDLIFRMEGYQRVILIDAVQMGERPGAWRRFTPTEVKLIAKGEGLSLHETGIAGALELAQALNQLPDEIVLYGIEPQNVTWSEELSPPVQEALPEVLEKILSELWKREA